MSEKLTIEQLRKQACYFDLTQKQKRLVECFLETGDKVASVGRAYDCKSVQTARVLSYSVFKLPRVIVALAVANGDDPQLAAFKADLLRASRNKKLTYPQVSALKLYAQLHGFVAGSLPTVEPDAENDGDPQKFQVGAIVEQDGKRYQIVAEEIE